MDYKIVSSSEWLYPDITEYKTSSKEISCCSVLGGYLSFQILLSNVSEKIPAQLNFNNLQAEMKPEFYELVPVYIAEAPFETHNAKPMYPIREGAYFLYDCMKPLENSLTVMNDNAALYISIFVPQNMSPATYEGLLNLQLGSKNIEIPYSFKIYNITLPDETLKFVNGYSQAAVKKYHNVEYNSEAFAELDKKYHLMMRRMHQNMLYTSGVKTIKTGENEYNFDFTAFENYVSAAIDMGFKYFIAPHIGGRKSWSESTIYVGNSLPCLSYEAYAYLSQYLKEFGDLLKKRNWFDMFWFGISDEPNEANAVEFRALCGLVRHLLPGAKLIDAMSYGPFFGSLDVYIPLNAEYDKHKEVFEQFRSGGDELWHYVCCGPRENGYINRFMDYPLLSTRYLFWGNYKYDLKGYLHWAVNHYQPDQDPFKDNWPKHRNADAECILPPGDTHLIYPGKDGPWMSIRLEVQRESAEEYELLRLLASYDKSEADRICNKCFKSFCDVENDPSEFEKIRIELLNSLSKKGLRKA